MVSITRGEQPGCLCLKRPVAFRPHLTVGLALTVWIKSKKLLKMITSALKPSEGYKKMRKIWGSGLHPSQFYLPDISCKLFISINFLCNASADLWNPGFSNTEMLVNIFEEDKAWYFLLKPGPFQIWIPPHQKFTDGIDCCIRSSNTNTMCLDLGRVSHDLLNTRPEVAVFSWPIWPPNTTVNLTRTSTAHFEVSCICLLYTSPSPRDRS